MITLELIIQRKTDDHWPIIAKATRPGVFLPVQSEGQLAIDEVELQSQTTPNDFGEYLGRAIFRDNIRDAFTRALTESEDALRFLLFVEDDTLKTWRWERLAAPIGGQWDSLLLNQRVYYTLHLPSYTDRRFPPIGRRDLRALVLVANPEGLGRYGLAEFDDQATVTRVLEALGEIPATVLASDHVREAVAPPTLDAFTTALNAEQYTILHLVAHGKYIKRRGETVLYLADEENLTAAVPASTLLQQLRGLGSAYGLPHLAFLSTCESAKPEAEGAMGGIAQRLVRELGMPAVVAMTDTVSIKTAGLLSEHFYTHLREHGEVDRALVEATAIFQNSADATVPALYSRLGGRPLFSDSLDRSLTNAEIAYGLDRVADLMTTRAPVLVPQFMEQADDLRATLGAETAALSRPMQETRQRLLTEINAQSEEVLDLNFNAIALDQQPPPYDDRCPFLGLYAFDTENKDFFFGREALVATLVDKLESQNLLAVLGPSGSGKSSLVLAGLIPALQSKYPQIRSIRITPSNQPLANLDSVLTALEFNQQTTSNPQLKENLQYLQAEKFINQDILLVVDQFEEIFTLNNDPTIREAFFKRLLSWCGLQKESSTLTNPLKVVITMRADFWGYCGDYPALKTAMQANQELIGRMQGFEMRRAMESQAAAVGLLFEPGLSSRIMDDVQNEPGAMPLLQHALLELWQRRYGRWLKGTEYEAIGGVQRAIAETAETIYQKLEPEQQIGVRNIFVRLTRVDGQSPIGDGESRDTRRRVPFVELIPADGDEAETRMLIEKLASARLIVTSVNSATDEEEVEVAHEAIIRYWPKLQSWLNESRSLLHLQADVQDSARAWHKAHQHDDLLQHRGLALEQVKPLVNSPYISLNQLETNYINSCIALRQREEQEQEEQRQKELRWQRRLNRMLQVGIVIALIFFVVSTYLYINANQARKDAEIAKINAETQSQIARAGELAASALAVFEQSAPLSLLLGIESVDGIPPQHRDIGVQTVLWETLNRTGGLPLYHHQAEVKAIAISPDGQWMISGDEKSRLHIWDLTSQPLTITRTIDTDQQAIISIVINQAKKWLVTGGLDGTTKLWYQDDLSQGKQVFNQSGAVHTLALSHDACWLVSGGEDKIIRVWSLCEGFNTSQTDTLAEPTQSIAGHTDGVTALAFSHDNQWLVSTAADFTTRLWHLNHATRKWEPQQTISEDIAIFSATFTPDGKRIITAGGTPPWISPTAQDAAIHIRAFDGNKVITNTTAILRGHQGYVTGLEASENGKWLISASWDKTIKRWNLQNLNQAPITLHGHEGFISAVAQGTNYLIVTGSSDHSLRLWDMRYPNGAPTIMEKHQAWVNHVAISADERWIVTVGEDGTAWLWPFQQPTAYVWQTHLVGETPFQLEVGDSSIKSLALSDDGRWLASGNDKGEVWLWNFPYKQGDTPIVLRGHEGSVEQLLISGDSRWLFSRDEGGTVHRWDLHIPSSAGVALPKIEGRVTTMAISKYGDLLVTGNSEGVARLWGVSNPVVPLMVFHGHEQAQEIRAVAISQRGKWVATGSEDTTIRLWPLASSLEAETPSADSIQAQIEQPFGEYDLSDPFVIRDHRDGVLVLSFSDDERWLASGSWDNTALLVNLNQPTPSNHVQKLRGHEAWVNTLAFTHDNQRLITGSHDGTARIWNLQSSSVAENPIVLEGHGGRINSIAISKDSAYLVTGSSDNTARQWVLSDKLLLEIACRVAGRTATLEESNLYSLGSGTSPACPE